MFDQQDTVYNDTFTDTWNSTAVEAKWGKGMKAVATNIVASSSAKTFVDGNVDVTANTITITAHGFVTGRKVAATSGGTLPGGLSATNYYVIKVDADTIKLATSLVNAEAATAVDITSAAGGGTHTLTPAALSGASIKLQWSPDNSNWYDISGQSQNVTATGQLVWSLDVPYYDYVRAVSAIAAGQVATTLVFNVFRFRHT